MRHEVQGVTTCSCGKKFMVEWKKWGMSAEPHGDHEDILCPYCNLKFTTVWVDRCEDVYVRKIEEQ